MEISKFVSWDGVEILVRMGGKSEEGGYDIMRIVVVVVMGITTVSAC